MQQQRRGNGNANPVVDADVIDAATGEVFGPTDLAQGNNDRAQLAVGAATALAMAAKEQAVVQARFARADIRPRNWNHVRQRILEECKRPAFADEAMYSKPVGGEDVTGLSIRFAETALQVIGNIDCFADLIDQDRTQCFYKVGALDLETNAQFSETLTITKTIERSKQIQGQPLIGKRKNSYGKDVFIYIGTEDDVVNNIRRAVSKSRRNAILALLRADIKEEARQNILATQSKRDAADPTAARKALVDAFYALGVKVNELEDYLGHPLDLLKPDELPDLRAKHAALRQGETTWAEVMSSRPERTQKAPSSAPVGETPPDVDPVASLLERIAKASKEELGGLTKEAVKMPQERRADIVKAINERRAALEANGGAQ